MRFAKRTYKASSDVLYIKALAAPDTINTMPEKASLAFAEHGAWVMDGGDAEAVVAAFAKAGIDDDRRAADLQREGAADFVASWKGLLDCIDEERNAQGCQLKFT